MPRKEPHRTCIATREVRHPDELMRFVLSPDGIVVPDLKRKLPGRGVWVSARREALETAIRRRLFSRAFRTEATVPRDLADAVDAALVTDLRQALSFANKAGQVITGFHKVEAALGSESIVALIHAAEAAEDGRRKIAQALRRRPGGDLRSIPVIDLMAGEDLDLALGRSRVIHAALVAGAGSKGFLERWRRLCVFRGSIAMADAPLDEGEGLDGNEPAGL